MSEIINDAYGQLAYETYCREVGGVSAISGVQLPTWAEQCAARPDIARAWRVAAEAIADQVTAELGC